MRHTIGVLAASAVLASAPTGSMLSAQSASQTSTALSALLADASARNRIPVSLAAYEAHVETEMGSLWRRADNTEFAQSLQQLASTIEWKSPGFTAQRVIGYREQGLPLSTSMLDSFRAGWLVPMLYGNRMRTRSFFDTLTVSRSADSAGTAGGVPVVHPLADDRDAFYTYSGGDTLVIIVDGKRRVPIVRVHVRPQRDVTSTVLVFEGDMDLDVTRGALVRLHGYFLAAGVDQLLRQTARILSVQAFVELENAEYEGKYWLPVRQRIEMQVGAPLFTEHRLVNRIVSRFTNMRVDTAAAVGDAEHSASPASTALQDSMASRPTRSLQWASRSSIDHYTDWQFPLGQLSSGLHVDDFAVVGPDYLRPTGPPRVDVASQFASDVFRYNRVEGAFTGLSLKLSLRDKAPGVTARATGGWAWREQTARGRASVDWARPGWSLGARAGRALEITTDFQRAIEPSLNVFETGTAIDYVDRQTFGMLATRSMLRGRLWLRGDLALVRDADAPTHVPIAPFSHDAYPANRGVDQGRYTRTAVIVEWQPRAADQGMLPGYTARLNFQRGDGHLGFARTEARLVARRFLGPFMARAQAEAGFVTGSRIPPQRLFELRRGLSLSNRDSSFAGSRAALLSGALLYTSPILRQPYRIPNIITIPAAAPGMQVSIQSGWADAHSAAARDAVRRLGSVTDTLGSVSPLATTTGSVRTTTRVGLRMFSGLLFLGWARELERGGVWRFTMAGGG